MTGPAEQPALPTATEDTPEVPGWAEKSVRDIFAALPVTDTRLDAIRDGYLDCLAGAGRTQDLDMEHDRCRLRAIAAIGENGLLPVLQVKDLDQRLAALEADITANL